MSRLKSSLFLSTVIVFHAGQAVSDDYFQQNYTTAYTPVPVTTQTTTRTTQKTGAGPVIIGALALGAAAVALGGGGSGGDDGDSDDDSSSEDDTDQSSDDDADEDLDEDGDDSDADDVDASYFETSEYKRSWGLSSINASSRYADGGTGADVIGAIFDTGVDVTLSEFDDIIDYTYSYYDGTSDVTDTDGHGTAVLGVMGANKDDVGMHGVAYDSTFLVFQGVGDDLIMSSIDAWADATIQSADLGATVINHSWAFVNDDDSTITIDQFSGSDDLLQAFGTDLFDALDYAVENDLVSVFAAGNSSKSEVSVIGGLPVYFPEYEDYFLVAVSIDDDDTLSSFSNACGMAADFCLAAPGESIYTTTFDDEYTYASGTSFAAPYVSGAVLVLASNFPELTASEITTILLETARDIGDPGVDEIYGYGALDLENAVSPQGTLSLQTSSTLNADSYSTEDSHISTSGGMASALASTLSSLDIMVTDSYDRGYMADLDDFVGSGMDAVRDQYDLALFTTNSASSLKLRTGEAQFSFAPNTLGAVSGDTLSYHHVSPYAGLIENPSSFAVETQLDGGSIKVSNAFSGDGSISDGFYVSAEATAEFGAGSLTLGAGTLSEVGAFIGTDVTGAFGKDLSANTQFVSLRGDLDIGGGRGLSLGGAIGTTDFSGDGIFESGENIQTSSIGIEYTQSNTLTKGDRFLVSASQSLNVDGGYMSLSLPTSLGVATNGVRSQDVEITTSSIDMSETTAPLDLRVAYEVSMFGGRFAIGAAIRSGEYGHHVGSFGYTIAF
jgi:subtilisin family serine protease